MVINIFCEKTEGVIIFNVVKYLAGLVQLSQTLCPLVTL